MKAKNFVRTLSATMYKIDSTDFNWSSKINLNLLQFLDMLQKGIKMIWTDWWYQFWIEFELLHMAE